MEKYKCGYMKSINLIFYVGGRELMTFDISLDKDDNTLNLLNSIISTLKHYNVTTEQEGGFAINVNLNNNEFKILDDLLKLCSVKYKISEKEIIIWGKLKVILPISIILLHTLQESVSGKFSDIFDWNYLMNSGQNLANFYKSRYSAFPNITQYIKDKFNVSRSDIANDLFSIPNHIGVRIFASILNKIYDKETLDEFKNIGTYSQELNLEFEDYLQKLKFEN